MIPAPEMSGCHHRGDNDLTIHATVGYGARAEWILPGQGRPGARAAYSQSPAGRAKLLPEFKLKLTFKFMKSITMLEFRRDAQRVLRAVGRGEGVLLTYRGKPVARLEPVRPTDRNVGDDDPLLRVDDFALDGPGGPLSNDEIDAVIYGAGFGGER